MHIELSGLLLASAYAHRGVLWEHIGVYAMYIEMCVLNRARADFKEKHDPTPSWIYHKSATRLGLVNSWIKLRYRCMYVVYFIEKWDRD